MDVKYIGGDVPWTLPFGDHFYSLSQTSFTDTHQNNLKSPSDLELIARQHEFEPLYTTKDTKLPDSNQNSQWMNAGVLFTDKVIEGDITGIHKTDFHDNHGHTFCYLCSINQHDHERTRPRHPSQRRKLIPYENPKALKPRSASIDRTGSSSLNSVPYRFIVRTGTRPHSGTRAQVFLYIYGTENNWTSINLRSRTNANSGGFPTGSIRTFCLKGPDIGQLHHLNVNLVGARSDKEWFLKEIEITNLNTSVTWLCEFNCWLPKKYEEDESQSTIPRYKDISLDNLCVYVLQVRTGGKKFAGTDSTIQVTIRGSTSQTRRLALTSDRVDLFEQNQLDTFAVVGWDIGYLSEISVTSDRTGTAADWDLKEMTMWKIVPSHDQKQMQIYFPFNAWLGTKTSTLKAKAESYASTDHNPRGPTCYQIEVKTGKGLSAGTNANVFIIIYGKSGRTTIHQLDNQLKDDFERGSTSIFTIMDNDVGEINQIKIWHDNSGASPGWFLDSVIIRKKHSTCRPVTEKYIQRLEETSKIFYQQACDQLKKNHKVRTPSAAKDNDRRSSKSRDNDDLGSGRGILRSPILYDRGSKKNVTWDEQSLGSQDDPLSMDPKRMTIGRQKSKKGDSNIEMDSGHFDHHAYWISSHNYNDKKWMIKSVEEENRLNLDKSIRSSLLSDRLASSSKIKTTVNEREDDVYEFTANRWLAKDEGDRKTEVILTPKSTKLSTSTNNELKSKPLSPVDQQIDTKKKHIPSSASAPVLQHEKYEHQHSKRSSQFDLGPLEKSPRGLAPLDRSPHDLRSSPRSQQKQEDSTHDKHHRSSLRTDTDRQIPSASQRDLFKNQFDDLRSSQRSQQKQEESARDKYHQPSSRTDTDRQASSAGQRDLFKNQFDDLRSSQRSQQKQEESALDKYYRPSLHTDTDRQVSSRIERDLSKNQFDDLRSSQRGQPKQEESALDKYYRPSSRTDTDRQVPSASQRDLLQKLSQEPSYHTRSAAASLIDTRSPSSVLADQRSKSSKYTDEPTSLLTSNRDSITKTSNESPRRPTSAVRSNQELSSQRTTRNQVYSSAYGTAPLDDF